MHMCEITTSGNTPYPIPMILLSALRWMTCLRPSLRSSRCLMLSIVRLRRFERIVYYRMKVHDTGSPTQRVENAHKLGKGSMILHTLQSFCMYLV